MNLWSELMRDASKYGPSYVAYLFYHSEKMETIKYEENHGRYSNEVPRDVAEDHLNRLAEYHWVDIKHWKDGFKFYQVFIRHGKNLRHRGGKKGSRKSPEVGR